LLEPVTSHQFKHWFVDFHFTALQGWNK